MRISAILLLLFHEAACEIDVDDKCPLLREPIEDFSVNDLLDKQWFVLEMVVHYQGNTPINEFISEEACDFHLNITGIENEIIVDNIKFTTIDQVLILWNSTITNRSLIKLDISAKNGGLWTKNETNIQVLSVGENITILTFCDSDRLFSLILTDDNSETYSDENYELADKETEIFKHYSLNVEAVKQFSSGVMLETYVILLGLCATVTAFKRALI